MNPSTELVNKLWRLCAVLRKDGITYQQYVTELTYLLFLKMMQEKQLEEGRVPQGLRWRNLLQASGSNKLSLYKDILAKLGEPEANVERSVQTIFFNAATILRDPQNLNTLVTAIDELDWYTDEHDSFGDLYEGLLQKNAEETKRGAGQYFTPRVLTRVIVDVTKPQPGEIIQDPAAGTGGFLIAADRYIRAHTKSYSVLADKGVWQKTSALHGMENVQDTYRLLLMNLYLHELGTKNVHLGDTLSPEHTKLVEANIILTNPPFGPAGGRPTRSDLIDTATAANYQLPFVEHCIRALKKGGRAAVVVPDNVLFEEGRGRVLRRTLMEECDLHTILRLPTGIFYAQGVKTNVLFFRKGNNATGNTKAVWVYDLRTSMPTFGKLSPLREEHFAEFIKAYGADPNGTDRPMKEGQYQNSRFRCFDRTSIAERHDNLDITWLRENSIEPEDVLTEPMDLAVAIAGHLKSALTEIDALTEALSSTAKNLNMDRQE